MWTINQTSGVASCSGCECEPVTTIKNYLCKMAKCACDLPCPHVAATKVVEVSQGTFCKGTVLKTCAYSIDTGGGGSGCCGGSSCSGCGGCCGKSCCGGNNTSPQNPAQPAASGCSGANCQASGTSASRGGVNPDGTIGPNDTVTPGLGTTNSGSAAAFDQPDETETADVINFAVEHAIEGVKMARDGISWVHDPVYEASKLAGLNPRSPRINPATPVMSTVADLVNSAYPGVVDNEIAMARDFRRSMCDRRPFPECEMCQWARNDMVLTELDLYDLLYGVQQGLDAIAKGQCRWGEQMFNCPGQLAALLRQELGPIGNILGPVAAATMIGMTAVHGALQTHDHLCGTFIDTPFRASILDSLGRAIKSGGCPNSYARTMGSIMRKLKIPAKTMFSGPSLKPSSAPIKLPHQTFAPGGFNSGGVKVSSTRGGTVDRTTHSTPTRDQLDPAVHPAISPATRAKADSVATVVDNITPPSPENDKPAKKDPKTNDVLVVTNDPVAVPNVDYYVNKKDPATGKQVPEVIPTSPNQPLDEIRAKYGDVYIKEKDAEVPGADFNPSNPPPAQRAGSGADDSTQWGAVPNALPGDTRGAVPTVVPKPAIAPSVKVKPVKPFVTPGSKYFVKDPETGKLVPFTPDPSLPLKDQVDGEGHPVEVFEEVVPESRHDVLPNSRPLVFNNGISFEPYVPVDSSGLDECVDTTTLITDSAVAVSEMASLYGVGLTVDEICLAYALDNAENGSRLPYDCTAVRIPTILDTLPDDEYE